MRVLVPAGAKLLEANGFDDYPLLSPKIDGAISDPDLEVLHSKITRDENTKMYIGMESGYAEFSNWLELSPGETKTVELTYELQFAPSIAYTQLVQKQPGAKGFQFSFELNYLPGNVVYTYPENIFRDGNKLTISETIATDRFYGVIGE